MFELIDADGLCFFLLSVSGSLATVPGWINHDGLHVVGVLAQISLLDLLLAHNHSCQLLFFKPSGNGLGDFVFPRHDEVKDGAAVGHLPLLFIWLIVVRTDFDVLSLPVDPHGLFLVAPLALVLFVVFVVAPVSVVKHGVVPGGGSSLPQNLGMH